MEFLARIIREDTVIETPLLSVAIQALSMTHGVQLIVADGTEHGEYVRGGGIVPVLLEDLPACLLPKNPGQAKLAFVQDRRLFEAGVLVHDVRVLLLKDVRWILQNQILCPVVPLENLKRLFRCQVIARNVREAELRKQQLA